MHLVHAGVSLYTFQFQLRLVAKLLERDVLLQFQFLVELVGIPLVHPDERLLPLAPSHLSQAAARGLQHHVLGTGTLVWQDDSCQALAIPSLLAYLHQQYDAHLGGRSVEHRKSGLRTFRLGIVFHASLLGATSLMAFEHHFGRIQPVLRHDFRNKRIDFLFQGRYLPTVDGQFGLGAVGISGIFILVKELMYTIAYDGRHVVVGELHHGAFQEVVDALYQRIVIHHVGDIGVLDVKATAERHLFRFLQIRSTREAEHIAERLALCRPLGNHLTELDFTV